MSRPQHTRLAANRAKSLRNQLTVSEARVWWELRAGQTGARFRRQVPIGPWIVDFACLNPRLVIEIDDLSHELRDEEDRTAYIERAGFPILRFTNEEVAKDIVSVISTIEYWIAELREGRRPE